jgi:hypothetical protein
MPNILVERHRHEQTVPDLEKLSGLVLSAMPVYKFDHLLIEPGSVVSIDLMW